MNQTRNLLTASRWSSGPSSKSFNQHAARSIFSESSQESLSSLEELLFWWINNPVSRADCLVWVPTGMLWDRPLKETRGLSQRDSPKAGDVVDLFSPQLCQHKSGCLSSILDNPTAVIYAPFKILYCIILNRTHLEVCQRLFCLIIIMYLWCTGGWDS